MLSSASLNALRDRAVMLSQVRQFFAARDVIEVDCPSLCFGASVDAHIDLIPAIYAQKEQRYLHSSPEYGMKRLLAAGIGDIYQLSHVFRDGEFGSNHNPEFMMAEWYRVAISFEEMIGETLDFIKIFLGNLPVEIISYRLAFKRYAGIDYLPATCKDLYDYIVKNNIPAYPGIENESKDALLNLILGTVIEPKLGADKLTALAYYPSTQSALAKVHWLEDECAAERFEVYYRGVELSNGYHELTDPIEQRKRFIESNEQRVSLGKEPLPVDEFFLSALVHGLPDCCGVAVGFDRLMMLRQEAKSLREVIPFAWDTA